MSKDLPIEKQLDKFKVKAIATKVNIKDKIIITEQKVLRGAHVHRAAQRYNVNFKKEGIDHYISVDLELVKENLVEYISLLIQKQILNFKLLSLENFNKSHKNFIVEAFKIKYETELEKCYISLENEEYGLQMNFYIRDAAMKLKNKEFKETYNEIMQNMFIFLKNFHNKTIAQQQKDAKQMVEDAKRRRSIII